MTRQSSVRSALIYISALIENWDHWPKWLLPTLWFYDKLLNSTGYTSEQILLDDTPGHGYFWWDEGQRSNLFIISTFTLPIATLQCHSRRETPPPHTHTVSLHSVQCISQTFESGAYGISQIFSAFLKAYKIRALQTSEAAGNCCSRDQEQQQRRYTSWVDRKVTLFN